MSNLKPLVLYSHRGTPNPMKGALLLEELGVPYTVEDVGKGMKEEPYISINPNGRAPSLADPNTGVKIFEATT
jgi:glutathione S-transferase